MPCSATFMSSIIFLHCACSASSRVSSWNERASLSDVAKPSEWDMTAVLQTKPNQTNNESSPKGKEVAVPYDRLEGGFDLAAGALMINLIKDLHGTLYKGLDREREFISFLLGPEGEDPGEARLGEAPLAGFGHAQNNLPQHRVVPTEKIDWQEPRKFDCRLVRTILGGAGRGRKLIGRKPANLIVGWCGRFLFIVPRQFSPDVGEWPENQILIPDWTYFHCPDGRTPPTNSKKWLGNVFSLIWPSQQAS